MDQKQSGMTISATFSYSTIAILKM